MTPFYRLYRRFLEGMLRLRFVAVVLGLALAISLYGFRYVVQEFFPPGDRNYDLILDGYREGVVSILDLLDAQTEALNANLDAANSVYLYLIDLMTVQRSVGQFDFFLSQEGRPQWFNKLDAFFRERGAEISQKQ